MPGRSPDEHVVTFCRTDANMADAAAAYLLGAIRQGGAGVAVVSLAHERQIDQRIAAAGIDPAAARAGGDYAVVDVNAVIGQVLTRGWPDPASFWRTMSPVIRDAGNAGQRPVHVCTEMVWRLWQHSDFGAAIEAEALWNELARQHRVGLLCACLGAAGDSSASADARGLGPDAADELALLIAAHTRVATISSAASGSS